MKNKMRYLISGSVILGSLLVAGTALAAGAGLGGFGYGMRPAVVGTVATAPSGSGTFTIIAKAWRHSDPTVASTTYTITTTSSTTIIKSGTASTVSVIAVGDVVMVKGTISGNTVTATRINDGVTGRRGMFGERWENASGTPIVARAQLPAGNGQPVIGGNVAAITGNSLTVTNKGSLTYTVDAASATITKAGITGATISNVAVGDSVIVQGAINGSSVTASSIIDHGNAPAGITPPVHRGFFGIIGGFFAHLFGF